MLSRTRFFFTKNTSVLKTLAQNKGCKLTLLPTKQSIFQSFKTSRICPTTSKITNSWKSSSVTFKRSYSTGATTSAIKATAESNSVPKPSVSDYSKSENPKVTSNRIVGYWLIGTSGLVFGIVVLGGLTRLTESGLSITEWKPVTGAIPPITQQDWEDEFSKYKESPEFKLLNSHITLEEFKFIFYMEWGHRLMGRFIGMFFILPAVYFWTTKRFTPHVTKRVIGLTGLLGLQGAIGWWMVKSGLDEEQLKERRSIPTVSQYRLTTHLGAAFLMYLGVLWTSMEILNENKYLELAKKSQDKLLKIFNLLKSSKINRIRAFGYGLLGLTFITAMSGGMVAGLDAGLIYNTFPHMGEDWIPSKGELFSPLFARKEDLSDLWWRNLLENPTTVQLVHRIFATTTFFVALWGHFYVSRNKKIIPEAARKAMHVVMGVATVQVALGITTLLYLVPINIAAAHQAGALALLTASLAFSAKLKRPRPQIELQVGQSLKNFTNIARQQTQKQILAQAQPQVKPQVVKQAQIQPNNPAKEISEEETKQLSVKEIEEKLAQVKEKQQQQTITAQAATPESTKKSKKKKKSKANH
ncbi:COX15 [[Candida] subhashii]|uniref:COX15 n=1 Tax=[Candida] subhashii TaxID=561895 RepID=A0A8J5QJ37_9ASCO|nr:COX15 [[Candida] subhashii]KAG7665631.1 COX15 [[Candida] subhashii]